MEITVGLLAENFVRLFIAYFEHAFKELGNPSWTNYYYWVLFWCVFCFGLETFLPKKQEYALVKRKHFWLDLFYVFFNDFLVGILGFFAFTTLVEALYLEGLKHFGIVPWTLFDANALPFLAKIAVLFILQDFLEFFAHFLLHRVPFLWEFHKVHHAQEELGFASTRHFHWGEYFIFKPLIYLPFSLLGFTVMEYVFIQLTVGTFSGFFTHCNVKTNFRFFNYIINNPETHFWHHAKNVPSKYKMGVNFASVLNIWDLVFGSYYAPKGKEPVLGVLDNNVPTSFLGQMWYPFQQNLGLGNKIKPILSAGDTKIQEGINQTAKRLTKKQKRRLNKRK